ncbi:MAG TPA: RsmB/NOP family class I SAM-dependent RNA methyltransferase [Opitutaceae bacterium]|nr:RsmB/NOP family class I SAM-dependent RNA methyltransferase [Opitutaceae bacterium]
MNPRIVANQQRHFVGFLAALRPHVRRDTALPRRIKEMLAGQRALGSRDRRLYRELIFTALRYWTWVEPRLDTAPDTAAKLVAWLAADLKDTHDFRAALCADWPAVPPGVAARAELLRGLVGPADLDPSALLPAFFRSHCPAAFEAPNLDALLTRAPLWTRLQVEDRSLVLDEFRSRGWTWQEVPGVPDALRLTPNADVGGTDAYRRGFVEIQDLGSQLILSHPPIRPGEHWLDACAGAGGKTLQLARRVGEAGRVDATDIRPEALEELRERGRRARLANVHVVAQPREAYDGVLVDAPCSGSGTWRRAPHLKWTSTTEGIERHAALQAQLLRENAGRVRPGGLLVYATCSLSSRENQEVVAAFLAATGDFSAEPPARDWGGARDAVGTTLLPATRDTDGFYVAVLRRRG